MWPHCPIIYSVSCYAFAYIGYAFYTSLVLTYTKQAGYPRTPTENREQKITGMNINVYAISTAVYIAICTSIENIQAAAQ